MTEMSALRFIDEETKKLMRKHGFSAFGDVDTPNDKTYIKRFFRMGGKGNAIVIHFLEHEYEGKTWDEMREMVAARVDCGVKSYANRYGK